MLKLLGLFMISKILIFFLLFSKSYAVKEKTSEATALSLKTYYAYLSFFTDCYETQMPNKQFEVDDVKNFLNYPSRTTVGFAPKFTSNRKFFANMISTPAFKDMLEKDKQKLWKSIIKKLKFCDETVMDQASLTDFYDREYDQSKN